MSRRHRLGVNKALSESNPVPDDATVLRAVAEIAAKDEKRYAPRGGALALTVAWNLGIQGMRRNGNGAVKGSWSGTMSPSLRVVPRLRSLVKRGLLAERHDLAAYGTRSVYRLTEAGRETLRGE